MTCTCDSELPEFYTAKMRIARKQHRCNECYSTIPRIEKYEYVSAKWEGKIANFKTCERCLVLRNYVESSIKCVCWSHENMIEDCIETLKEYAHELPGLLFGGYRRMLRAQKRNKYIGIWH